MTRPLGDAYGADTRMVWLPDAKTSRVGYWGAPQTIALMAKAVLEDAAHFDTRRLVELACEGITSKDYTSEYLAWFHFILQHTRYMRDPRRTELVKAPWVISQQILAGRTPSLDCDELSGMMAAGVIQMGGKAEFVTVAFDDQMFDGRRQFSHVFSTALEPRNGVKIVLDPVAAEKTAQMIARVKFHDVWPITT